MLSSITSWITSHPLSWYQYLGFIIFLKQSKLKVIKQIESCNILVQNCDARGCCCNHRSHNQWKAKMTLNFTCNATQIIMVRQQMGNTNVSVLWPSQSTGFVQCSSISGMCALISNFRCSYVVNAQLLSNNVSLTILFNMNISVTTPLHSTWQMEWTLVWSHLIASSSRSRSHTTFITCSWERVTILLSISLIFFATSSWHLWLMSNEYRAGKLGPNMAPWLGEGVCHDYLFFVA